MNQRESIATRISSLPSDRRSLLKAVGVGAAGIAGMPLLAACTAQRAPAGTGSTPRRLRCAVGVAAPGAGTAGRTAAGPAEGQQRLGQARRNGPGRHGEYRAAGDGRGRGVPGRGGVLQGLRGAGGRQAREVDPDTVFQVASVSKPLASTVVAGRWGGKVINWTDPVIDHNPDFALKDDYVTRNATVCRSVVTPRRPKTGSGDLLEDLGFDRAYILGHLNQEPLDTFRSSYNYSNFGYTAGGQAAADAMKMSWEDLADEVCSGRWACPPAVTVTRTTRRQQTGQSSTCRRGTRVGGEIPPRRRFRGSGRRREFSVRDLAQWLRLQLGNGSYEGKPVIDPAALQTPTFPMQSRAGVGTGCPLPLLRAGLERLLRRPGPAPAGALRSLQSWRRDRRLHASRRTTGHCGPDQRAAAGDS